MRTDRSAPTSMNWDLGRSGVWKARNTAVGKRFYSLPAEQKEVYIQRAAEVTEAALAKARIEETENPEIKRAR